MSTGKFMGRNRLNSHQKTTIETHCNMHIVLHSLVNGTGRNSCVFLIYTLFLTIALATGHDGTDSPTSAGGRPTHGGREGGRAGGQAVGLPGPPVAESPLQCKVLQTRQSRLNLI